MSVNAKLTRLTRKRGQLDEINTPSGVKQFVPRRSLMESSPMMGKSVKIARTEVIRSSTPPGPSTTSTTSTMPSSAPAKSAYPYISKIEIRMQSGPIDENFVWTEEAESLFFRSLMNHKPLGENRHFNMLLASHDFQAALGHKVDIQKLWGQLKKLYDLNELETMMDTNENFPKVDEFVLPDVEFAKLLITKTDEQTGMESTPTIVKPMGKKVHKRSITTKT